jgi:hypothetical protein
VYLRDNSSSVYLCIWSVLYNHSLHLFSSVLCLRSPHSFSVSGLSSTIILCIYSLPFSAFILHILSLRSFSASVLYIRACTIFCLSLILKIQTAFGMVQRKLCLSKIKKICLRAVVQFVIGRKFSRRSIAVQSIAGE